LSVFVKNKFTGSFVYILAIFNNEEFAAVRASIVLDVSIFITSRILGCSLVALSQFIKSRMCICNRTGNKVTDVCNGNFLNCAIDIQFKITAAIRAVSMCLNACYYASSFNAFKCITIRTVSMILMTDCRENNCIFGIKFFAKIASPLDNAGYIAGVSLVNSTNPDVLMEAILITVFINNKLAATQRIVRIENDHIALLNAINPFGIGDINRLIDRFHGRVIKIICVYIIAIAVCAGVVFKHTFSIAVCNNSIMMCLYVTGCSDNPRTVCDFNSCIFIFKEEVTILTIVINFATICGTFYFNATLFFNIVAVCRNYNISSEVGICLSISFRSKLFTAVAFVVFNVTIIGASRIVCNNMCKVVGVNANPRIFCDFGFSVCISNSGHP